MSKRSVTELQTTSVDDGQAYLKASGSGAKRENIGNNEMGEFEDAWEDEIESDEEVMDRDGDDGDGTFFLKNSRHCKSCLI
jgi:ribosome assembly protein RRB1